MSEIDFEGEARIEGGIKSFRDVLLTDQVPVEIGKIAVVPTWTDELPPGIVEEDDEPLDAA